MSDVPEVIQRAARVFPGGVLGSHRSGPGLEFVVREGRGPHLWDTEGRKYIDYLLGSGPMLLGHAHPAVVGAVQRQLSHGTTYMLLTSRSSSWPRSWCARTSAASRCASRRVAAGRRSSPCARPAPTGAATSSSRSRAAGTA